MCAGAVEREGYNQVRGNGTGGASSPPQYASYICSVESSRAWMPPCLGGGWLAGDERPRLAGGAALAAEDEVGIVVGRGAIEGETMREVGESVVRPPVTLGAFARAIDAAVGAWKRWPATGPRLGPRVPNVCFAGVCLATTDRVVDETERKAEPLGVDERGRPASDLKFRGAIGFGSSAS